MSLAVTLFTDPACPFAFSAEPVRWRLRWHYGNALDWSLRMIVLTREAGEADKLAEGAPGLQRLYGMPITHGVYARPASSEPACRAVVAAREHAGHDAAERLLRALRVRVMQLGLLDDHALIDAVAVDAGIGPEELGRWTREPETEAALEADIAAAREPSPAARALNHKLGGPAGERRYTAPSYIIDGVAIPGFNPIEVYETVIANRAPQLPRRPAPGHVEELLAWAGTPLATAEVALVMGMPVDDARTALRVVAVEHPAGADAYWTAASGY